MKNTGGVYALISLFLFVIVMSSCKKQQRSMYADDGRPRRSMPEYFDKKYLLYKLPADYYKDKVLNQSFAEDSTNSMQFKPFGYTTDLRLQYTHVYSDKCVYHTADSVWRFAEISFPNTCLTKDFAYAEAIVSNNSKQEQTYYLRLYYQNTTYWYRTDDSMDLYSNKYLDNYYGASQVVTVTALPGEQLKVKVPYTIGLNPKHEFDYDPAKDPARAGNYEFMLLCLTDKENILMKETLDLQKINPFAVVKLSELNPKTSTYHNHMAYVGPQHFKFVQLDEYFDKTDDVAHIFPIKDSFEKKLCDTCSGWYRAVINEYWKSTDFFKGFISKSYFVKADYGIRKENCWIDSNGITIKIPKSRRGVYKKTWGEFLFGPAIKYGHLTVRAKFAQMMNKTGVPNGIIHNLWLYERDREPVDSANPYHNLVNSSGSQPYEIDFEIWNSQENINTMWDENAFINYSIVDYMRNPNIQVKPGENKKMGRYKPNRLNDRQLNIPGENIDKEYFNYYHTYELYWYPDSVRFMVDGYEQAVITKDMASIPDKYLFLWIGSPLYQDGTYYQQSSIPFLKEDKYTIVDYIKIE